MVCCLTSAVIRDISGGLIKKTDVFSKELPKEFEVQAVAAKVFILVFLD